MFGNLGEMTAMLGKIGEIKKTIESMKDELPRETHVGTSSAGRATVVLSGDFEVKSLSFEPGTSGAEVAEAVNCALAKGKESLKERIKSAAGGMNIPGL